MDTLANDKGRLQSELKIMQDSVEDYKTKYVGSECHPTNLSECARAPLQSFRILGSEETPKSQGWPPVCSPASVWSLFKVGCCLVTLSCPKQKMSDRFRELDLAYTKQVKSNTAG